MTKRYASFTIDFLFLDAMSEARYLDYNLSFLIGLLLQRCVTATLINNASTACPGESITFTCILAGTVVRWTVDPPPGSVFNHTQSMILTKSNQMFSVGSPGFMFQAVLTEASEGNLTSILTTVTNVSLIEGSNVTCSNATTTLVPLTINVADPPSPPLNPTLTSFQNGTSTSVVTLQWSPPSSPGGVDVSYVLTISPTPVSGSPVTAQSNSVGITVPYNIPYNVTIRADNCAGSSGDTVKFTLVSCPPPSPASGIVLTNVPNILTEGTTLTFTCSFTNEMINSTCNNDGRWSPDPGNYNYCIASPTTPTTTLPVTCGSPGSPFNGSVDVGGQSPPYPLGSMITFHCDDGLFPSGLMTSTCVNVGGMGKWSPIPAGTTCRTMPINCSFPREPVNGNISDYDNINILEGSVITFQCDPGFSPEGEMTATCNNFGLWTNDPAGVICTQGTSSTLSIGGIVGITAVISVLIGLMVGMLLMYFIMCTCTKNNKTNPPQEQPPPPGPVYEEVSTPKENIELETNQAYGPVGH